MQLLQDGVIALLAAIGLTALLWSLAGVDLPPARADSGDGVSAGSVRGAAPGMEQTLRALRGSGIDRRAEVLLADCGLTDEARRRAELWAVRRRADLYAGGAGADFTGRGRVLWASDARWREPYRTSSFRMRENGYTVLSLLTDEGELVTVVGCIPCAARPARA